MGIGDSIVLKSRCRETHTFEPAYWRKAHPSYKRCSKCGVVKAGTEEEKKAWAENSPWKKEKAEPR